MPLEQIVRMRRETVERLRFVDDLPCRFLQFARRYAPVNGKVDAADQSLAEFAKSLFVRAIVVIVEVRWNFAARRPKVVGRLFGVRNECADDGVLVI